MIELFLFFFGVCSFAILVLREAKITENFIAGTPRSLIPACLTKQSVLILFLLDVYCHLKAIVVVDDEFEYVYNF